MTINFTMSDEQKKLQYDVRAFAENVLKPVVAEADAEPDPLKGFQMTKPAYIESYRAGHRYVHAPGRVRRRRVSCVDLVIAAEEICVVDPGFACTVLCNGLGLMPVAWYGSEEQKNGSSRRGDLRPDRPSTWAAGPPASRPATRPAPRTSTSRSLGRPGVGLTAVRDGDHFVVNGRKYWPSSAGWDERGVNAGTLIVRTDSDKGGTEGLSALVLERDTPGVTYRHLDKVGHRLASNAEIIFEDALIPAANLLPGAEGNGDLVINRNFAWSVRSPRSPPSAWLGRPTRWPSTSPRAIPRAR